MNHLPKDICNNQPFDNNKFFPGLNYELILLFKVVNEPLKKIGLIFFQNSIIITNRKTESNNHCTLSSNYIEKNYNYPEAYDETRKRIIEDHKNYIQVYLCLLAIDSIVPANFICLSG